MKNQKTKANNGKRQRGLPPATCSAQIEELYKAVQKYVESGGGKLVVIGGIAIQDWPTDNPMVFNVAVKCCGRKPSFVATNDQALPQGGAKKGNDEH